MAVQPVDMHTPVNHYFTENISENVTSLNRTALLYSVIERISQIAVITIIASIYFVSYSSISLTGTLPLIFAGMTFSTIFFVWVMSHFRTKANQFSRVAELEQQTETYLTQIKNWDTPRILEFLREEGIEPANIPVNILRRFNNQEPYRALLPLIARYKFFKETSDTMRRESIDALAFKIEQDIQEAEALKGPIDENQRRITRLYARDTYYRKYETEAIPRILEAAYLLQIIQNPTRQSNILSIGEFRSKNFEERMFDRSYPPRNDHFFLFYDSQRNPITLAEIEQDPRPLRIRQRLFA